MSSAGKFRCQPILEIQAEEPWIIGINIHLRSLNEEDTTFSSVGIDTKLFLIGDGEKYEEQLDTIENLHQSIWEMEIDALKKLWKINRKK